VIIFKGREPGFQGSRDSFWGSLRAVGETTYSVTGISAANGLEGGVEEKARTRDNLLSLRGGRQGLLGGGGVMIRGESRGGKKLRKQGERAPQQEDEGEEVSGS